MAWTDKFSGILDKLSGSKADYADDYEEYEDYQGVDSDSDLQRRGGSSYASVQPTKAYRMIIVEPYSFDDSAKVGDHLLQNRPVLINLEKTEEEICRRLIDFVAGVIYAEHGSLEQVNESIYLAVPRDITVDKENYTYTTTKTTTDFGADLPQWNNRP